MNSFFAALAVAMAPSTTPELRQLELKLVFDSTEVRLGDLAYCEVQLWNRGLRGYELPKPSQPGNLSFEVRVGEAVFRPDVNGGGLFVPAAQRVLPNESIRLPAQVILWDQESLSMQLKEDSVLNVRADMLIDGNHLYSERVQLEIDHRVASGKLLAGLYLGLVRRSDAHVKYHNAGRVDEWYHQMLAASAAELMHQKKLSASVLDALLEGIDDETALHRKVEIARLLQRFNAAEKETREKMSFEQFKESLFHILSTAGPAERRWLLHRTGSALEIRGMGREAHQVYQLESTPPAL